MNRRNYNVFFNIHTISGIVISVGLFIIFFAGCFSFFRDEIVSWERSDQVNHKAINKINYDLVFEKLDQKYKLHGRDVNFSFDQNHDYLGVILSETKDTITNPQGISPEYFDLNINTFSEHTYIEGYSLGEFIYRLHFLDPIIYPIGRHLAGLIAIFFVFAIITGVIIHWKKIIPNFYRFNPKAMFKNVWADAHTTLGIIGLPFQFIYGVTGAFFIVSVFVLIPANILYNNNQEKLLEDIRPSLKTDSWQTSVSTKPVSVNTILQKTKDLWSDFNIKSFNVVNSGGANMKYVVSGELDTKKRFIGLGRVEYNAYSGDIISMKNPNELNYLEDFQKVSVRLHFANFGGITTRIIYFVFGLLTCFVIISGVLVWVESRNKKSISLKRRLFTTKVGHIYMAICLSMFPVTALSFLFVKITQGMFSNPQTAIYYFYFTVWFGFILFFRFKRNNYYTNKVSLLLGAIFGFLIPIANGLFSGNWFWITYANYQFEILTVDILWLLLSSIALLFYFNIKPSIRQQSVFDKNPIDYKDIKDQLMLKRNTKLLITKKEQIDINFIPMRTKIIILWMLIIFGYIFHHIYGLATVFFNDSVAIEGANGEIPMWVHKWRFLMEGSAFIFVLLTLTFKNNIFKLVSLTWAAMVALFNCYHFVEEIMEDSSNFSGILILFLTAVASILLTIHLYKWRKLD